MNPPQGAFDAIVVGGGPGGSTAAWRLARAGARVALLDAARFPRVKLCAGWVTPTVWRTLELDPRAYPLTIQAFSGATVELDGNVFETAWPRTASYGIVRREFDHYLLERARREGATVSEGERVRRIARDGDLMRVETEQRTLSARILIGAGGHNCPVARALGEISALEATVVTQESETRVGAERLRSLTRRAGTPELFAEPDFRGYGWYFTKGDYLNLGIGCLGDGRDLHRRCRTMVEHLRADGRLSPDLELEPMRGHAYAIRIEQPRRIAGAGFLLVGDAAGLARAVSGEGIGPAVESGALAAEAAGRSLNGSGPLGAADWYSASIDRRFGSGEPGWAERLFALLPRAAIERVGRLVCRSSVLRRRLLFEGAFGMG
jgi:menaquinone-9 beta-reductase